MKQLIVLAIALISASAFARPNTVNMSCRDAAGLVDQAGAITLNHGQAGLYQRFVAGPQFCGSGEVSVGALVTTLDNDSCRIGYVCVNADRNGGGTSVKKFPATIKGCKEGSKGSALATDYYPNKFYGDKVPSIAVVCKAGKWVPANDLNWKAKTVGGAKCADGAKYTYPEPAYNGVPLPGSKTYVCSNGKWYLQ